MITKDDFTQHGWTLTFNMESRLMYFKTVDADDVRADVHKETRYTTIYRNDAIVFRGYIDNIIEFKALMRMLRII